jgi:hypothetical protein
VEEEEGEAIVLLSISRAPLNSSRTHGTARSSFARSLNLGHVSAFLCYFSSPAKLELSLLKRPRVGASGQLLTEGSVREHCVDRGGVCLMYSSL